MEPTEKLKELLWQEADECENCGNAFKVLQIKEGEDWNDFGHRYCYYCGMFVRE